MIERRREPRLPANLAVMVWGRDTHGEQFVQVAFARNISRSGALLSGIRPPLRCGDLIGIRYAENTARFRIVWSRDSGTPDKFQVAVQKLQQDACPWLDALRVQTVASLAVSESSAPPRSDNSQEDGLTCIEPATSQNSPTITPDNTSK